MYWKELVTDGHVRAARWRLAKPFIILLAIILCTIGGYGLLNFDAPEFPKVKTTNNVEKWSQKSTLIRGFFSNPPTVKLDAAAQAKLAPAYEIDKIVEIIQKSLDETNQMPSSLPLIKMVKGDFWQFDWSVENLPYFIEDNIIVVGAVVSGEHNLTTEEDREVPNDGSAFLENIMINGRFILFR